MSLWADPGRWISLALLSGWAAIDTTEVAQLMVGQPIPAGFLAGWIVGQPELGLFVGASLQLLWSRLAPVGAASFPDVGPATVAGVAVGAAVVPVGARWSAAGGAAALLPGPEFVSAVLVAAGVALLTARINQEIVVAHRRANLNLARRADAAAAAGSFAGVEAANLGGITGAFARGVVTALVVPGLAGVALGLLHGPLASGLPRSGLAGGGHAGFSLPFPNLGPALIWSFGLAALGVTLLRARRDDWLLLAGGALVGLLLAAVRA